jgi:membrane-associated protease RseP (regulator of RpoE activity)
MMRYLLFTLVCGLFPIFLVGQSDAYLGVHSNHISNQKARQLDLPTADGRYITQVVPGSPADQAGLKPFDYLYGMDDEPFTDDRDFHDRMDEYQPGDKVSLQFQRAGEALTSSAQLIDDEQADQLKVEDGGDPFLGVSYLHQQKQPRQGPVVGIVRCSTAAGMGLQDEDVIVQIDDYPVLDWHDLSAAIDARKVGDPIRVTYMRDGETFTAAAPIRSASATHDAEQPCPEDAPAPVPTPEEPIAQVIPAPTEEAVAVSMEEVQPEEAKAMEEEKGIDMPLVNDLTIEKLNVFPNPNTGLFTLRFDLPQPGSTNIRIFNSSGREVYSYQLSDFQGTFEDQINLTNEFAGTYFLMVQQGAQSMVKKVVITR